MTMHRSTPLLDAEAPTDRATGEHCRIGRSRRTGGQLAGGISFELMLLLGATTLFGAVIALGSFDTSAGTSRSVNPDGAIREIALIGESGGLAVRYPTHCVLGNSNGQPSSVIWPATANPHCTALASCPRRSRILVGWGDGWLNLHEVPSCHVVWRSRPVCVVPTRVAFSPDGASLAVVSIRGELALLDADTGRTRWKTPASDRPRLNVCFSADGTRVFTGNEGRGVIALEAKSGLPVEEYVIEEPLFTSLAAGPRGRWLAMGTSGGEIVLWDLKTGKLQYRQRLARNSVLTIGFSSDARQLVFTSTEGSVATVELDGEYRHRIIGTHDDPVFAMARRDDTLITGSTDGDLRFWPRVLAHPEILTNSRDGSRKHWPTEHGEPDPDWTLEEMEAN